MRDMPATNFTCPGCGKTIEVNAEDEGRRAKCRGCGQVSIIGGPRGGRAFLIACPDCTSEISSRAHYCPRCGAPICGYGAKLSISPYMVPFLILGSVGLLYSLLDASVVGAIACALLILLGAIPRRLVFGTPPDE
jgi:uncharacterized paraquat-inducible protein A